MKGSMDYSGYGSSFLNVFEKKKMDLDSLSYSPVFVVKFVTR